MGRSITENLVAEPKRFTTLTQINRYTMFITPHTQPVPYIHSLDITVYVT